MHKKAAKYLTLKVDTSYDGLKVNIVILVWADIAYN